MLWIGRVCIYLGATHVPLTLIAFVATLSTLGSAGEAPATLLLAGVSSICGLLAAIYMISAGIRFSTGDASVISKVMVGVVLSAIALLGLAGYFAIPSLIGGARYFLPVSFICVALAALDVKILFDCVRGAESTPSTPLDVVELFTGRAVQQRPGLRLLLGLTSALLALSVMVASLLWSSPSTDAAIPVSAPSRAISAPVAPASSAAVTFDCYDTQRGLPAQERAKVIARLRGQGYFKLVEHQDFDEIESTFDEMLRDEGRWLQQSDPDFFGRLATASRRPAMSQGHLRSETRIGDIQISVFPKYRSINLMEINGVKGDIRRYEVDRSHIYLDRTQQYCDDFWPRQAVERAIRKIKTPTLTLAQARYLAAHLQEVRLTNNRSLPRDQITPPVPTLVEDRGGAIVVTFDDRPRILDGNGNVLRELPSVAHAREQAEAEATAAMLAAEAARTQQRLLPLRVSSVVAGVGALVLFVWGIHFAQTARTRTLYRPAMASAIAFVTVGGATWLGACVALCFREAREAIGFSSISAIFFALLAGASLLIGAGGLVSGALRRVKAVQ